MFGFRPRQPIAISATFAACCGSLLLAACGGGSKRGPIEAGERTFDVSSYEAAGRPMRISNEALLFPVRNGSGAETPTRSEPGDLWLAYVRIVCNVREPHAHLERNVRSDELPPDAPWARLTGIRISQVMNEDWRLRPDWFEPSTCFTYRDHAGMWHSVIPPTETQIGDEVATASITLDIPGVTAAGILLPLSTSVTSVSYTTGSQ